MPELCVPVFSVAVYLYVCTSHFPWHCLLFTMGMAGKQEVMQHYTMLLCLKWNFGRIKDAVLMVSRCPSFPACVYHVFNTSWQISYSDRIFCRWRSLKDTLWRLLVCLQLVYVTSIHFVPFEVQAICWMYHIYKTLLCLYWCIAMFAVALSQLSANLLIWRSSKNNSIAILPVQNFTGYPQLLRPEIHLIQGLNKSICVNKHSPECWSHICST